MKLEDKCDNCNYKIYVTELFAEMVKEVKMKKLERNIIMKLAEESSTKPEGDEIG